MWRSPVFCLNLFLIVGIFFLSGILFTFAATVSLIAFWIIAYFFVWLLLIKLKLLEHANNLLFKIGQFKGIRWLQVLPGIEFGDMWVVEEIAEPLDLSAFRGWKTFIKRKAIDYVILFPGTLMFLIRLFTWIIDKDAESISDLTYGLSLILFPIVYFLIFIPIWTIDDSGIKAVNKKEIKITTDHIQTENDLSNEVIEEVSTLGRIFRGTVTYFIGLPSLFWFIDRVILSEENNQLSAAERSFLSPVYQSFTGFILVLAVALLILFLGFPGLYLGTLYYYHKYHQYYVNNLRIHALDSLKEDPEQPLVIGTLEVKKAAFLTISTGTPKEKTYATYVKKVKERVLSKWRR